MEPRVLGNHLFDPENDCVLNLDVFPRKHMTEAQKEILDEYEMDKLRATVRPPPPTPRPTPRRFDNHTTTIRTAHPIHHYSHHLPARVCRLRLTLPSRNLKLTWYARSGGFTGIRIWRLP